MKVTLLVVLALVASITFTVPEPAEATSQIDTQLLRPATVTPPRYATGFVDAGCGWHWFLRYCDMTAMYGTTRSVGNYLKRHANVTGAVIALAIGLLCLPAGGITAVLCAGFAAIHFGWFADEVIYATDHMRCYKLRMYWAGPLPAGVAHGTVAPGTKKCKVWA